MTTSWRERDGCAFVQDRFHGLGVKYNVFIYIFLRYYLARGKPNQVGGDIHLHWER